LFRFFIFSFFVSSVSTFFFVVFFSFRVSCSLFISTSSSLFISTSPSQFFDFL